MQFNRRNRRFGSRFSRSSRPSTGAKGSESLKRKAGEFGTALRGHYNGYIDSLELHKRTNQQRLVLLAGSAFTAIFAVFLFATVTMSVFLPSVRNAERLLNVESTIFYDRNGKVLYTVSGEENREIIKSENIPDYAKQAAIAIEDTSFYEHKGFDLAAILKAILSEFGIGSPRGGSTITQQFVKNAILSNERTYTRKFKEIILATRIEKHYNKDEIITMYLNKIPYGGTAYGIQKASEVFFDKEAKELTLAESVILAALPNAPTYYSPYGNHRYSTIDKEFTIEELKKRKIKDIDDLFDTEYSYGLIGKSYTLADGTNIYLPGRTDEVLREMEEQGYMKKSEREKTLAEIQLYEFNEYAASIKAPHFVFYVKELLEEKYGKEMVESSGMRVFTTLDLALYEEAKKLVEAQAASNDARFNSDNQALVAIEPKTGEVLAMVGSAGYVNQEIDGSVNMTTALRQPGSSFKPIVYASAFLKNTGPGTVFYDVPTKIGEDTPKNYDGGFIGPISARKALGQSRNIPAIKAYYLGGQQDEIITLSENMGITSLDRRIDYGWPLSLGTGEVKMIDMAVAFGVFANGGYRVDVNPILKVQDKDGKILEDYTKTVPKKLQVLDPQVAYLMNDVLSDKSVNLGGSLNLADGRKAGIKTGTSTKRIGEIVYPTNLWAVGYTPQLVTAVWSGNSDGTQTELSADGYNASVPTWNKFMSFALKDKPKSDFEKPKGIKSVQISKLSGKLPSKSTPENMVTTDIFASFSVPTEVDNSFYLTQIDTRNNKKPNAFCPTDFVKEVTFYNPKSEIPDFLNWQSEIISWFNGLAPEKVSELNLGNEVRVGSPLEEESELCRADFADNLQEVIILDYMQNDVVPKGLFRISANAEAEAGIEKVEFFLDDEMKVADTSSPFEAELRVPVGFNLGQKFKVRAKVIDKNGYSKNDELELVTGERAEAEEPVIVEE